MKKPDDYNELKKEIERKEKQILAEKRRRKRRLILTENRARYLENKKDRRDRTHRLITRGAAVEHFYPQTETMSEREFYELVEGINGIEDVNGVITDHIAGIIANRTEKKED